MVEFGLKLEDNKVSEWSEHYVHYEKLKTILKKSAKAVDRYNELHAKRPETAMIVEEEFRKGMPTPKVSQVDLTAIATEPSMPLQRTNGDDDEASAGKQLSEGTALLPSTATSEYGASDLKHSESTNLLSRALGKAASGVTDYFQKSYERQLHEALKAMDKYAREFENELLNDLQQVNAFYKERYDELEGRLNLLKESVATSFAPPAPPPAAATHHERQDSDMSSTSYMETPLIRNRRKVSSTFAIALARFSHQLHPVGERKEVDAGGRVSVLPLLHDVEEEDDVQYSSDEKARREREIDSIQRSLVDLYRSAKLLHNFAIMNYTAFVKIVKKHDKTLPEHKGRFVNVVKPEKVCNEGKDVEKLTEHMERLYANWFCDRNMSQARAQLLPKKGDGLEMDWSQLRLGYRMGMCSVLGLWVCWDCIWGLLSKGTSTIGGRTAFPVFRACGGLLLLQWFWGCSIWVWTRYRVNYIFLFDFNPHVVSSPLAVFNEAVDNSLVFLLGMLLYYKAGAHAIPGNFPAGIFPCVMVVYTVYQLVFPLRSRRPMWFTIWQVVTAPMYSPTFFHGYVGDIFTSMVKVFQDVAWSLFFIFSGDWLISEDLSASTKHRWAKSLLYSKVLIPILTLLPLWFRFNQCLRRYADTGQRLPHLANAFKYAMSMSVTLFGAFHPLYLERNAESNIFQLFWMFAFVASSLYSFSWDVYMDWGLGRLQYNFLGPRLMYPSRLTYYAIICIDLVLRFAWVLTLVPPNSGASFGLPQYLTAVSMMLELFRRTIWGFLRLENEHRSNTSGYRRVDFVPLHFATGHAHGYKQEKEHRGLSVLMEVAIVTLVVLAAAVASVVAAQHETEKLHLDDL